jgi:hypothetical protein
VPGLDPGTTKSNQLRCYFFALRFFDFLAVFRFFEAFFGTFAPAALASERPIAIACLRLFTLRPDRPLFKVPALRFFIARSTPADAFLEYFRAMTILPEGSNRHNGQKFQIDDRVQSDARSR